MYPCFVRIKTVIQHVNPVTNEEIEPLTEFLVMTHVVQKNDAGAVLDYEVHGVCLLETSEQQQPVFKPISGDYLLFSVSHLLDLFATVRAVTLLPLPFVQEKV